VQETAGKLQSPGRRIGMAFDLADANGQADQKAYFWSAGAKNESPKTWGIAVAEPKRGIASSGD
jgi:hypothetical protein